MNNDIHFNSHFTSDPEMFGHTAILGQSGAGKSNSVKIVQDIINNKDNYVCEPLCANANIWFNKSSLRKNNNESN
ncbi:hypothetical protein ABH307_00530 [Acinetobacter pittii]|uniref:hypothetical protein n=1 Tax=Acinetobacter pittii TaxID=48296 RepID=UPI00325FF3E9